MIKILATEDKINYFSKCICAYVKPSLTLQSKVKLYMELTSPWLHLKADDVVSPVHPECICSSFIRRAYWHQRIIDQSLLDE